MKALIAIEQGTVFDTFFTKENIALADSLGEIVWLDMLTATEQDLLKKISDCDTYISCWGSPKITPEVLKYASKLKLITHLGSTVAPIVCPEVYQRGIKVISGFDYYSESTAEGTIAYMLASLRNIPFFTDRLKKQKIWTQPQDFTNSLIYKTVGIVGYGGVGRHVVKKLQNFNVKIKVFDIIEIAKEEKQLYGIEQCDIEEIFSTCDIISLHLPYTDATYHIIDDKILSKIKKGALFVNTSRGAVVDEQALIGHLEKNDFYAALDVYEKEPIDMNSPLLSLDNVLMLPHQGGPTVNLRTVITRILLKESADFIKNGVALKNEISAQKAKNMSKF